MLHIPAKIAPGNKRSRKQGDMRFLTGRAIGDQYMENPFDNPTTLRDPRHFVGRRYELERVFGLIKSRQNASLVGPRRIGKTSLLTYLRNPSIQQEFGFDGKRF